MSLQYSTWREFVPLIQLSVPECPIPVMADAIRRAAMEFCRETSIWRHTSEPSDLVAGQASYDCTVDEPGIEVAGIVRVKVDGVEITPATNPEWDDLDKSREDSRPRRYRFVEPGLVQFWPTPNESVDGGVEIEVALMPTILSTRGPSFLLTRHDVAMSSGAKRNLMVVPGQPWSNPQNAAYEDGVFKGRIAATKINETQGGTRKSLSVRPRKFL